MIKWIGQHIVDLIARFRSDVYLENIDSGTIASGSNLGLDSNNKIVKASEATVADADATTKGIVELATTAETTTGTDATRAVTPDGLQDGFYGSTNIRTLGDITTGSWRGSAIDQTYLIGQSGTNTGDQTSVSGNAGTATALATARNINGVSFDGTGDITVTAAGSTLSDTVTVEKGGTGATSLTSNSILTGNGTSAVQAESGLTYNSEALVIGDDDNGAAQIKRLRHTDDAGGDLYIRGGDATGTDKAGGDLQIFGGRATGNAAGGAVIIQSGETHGSGGVTTLRGTNVIASFRSDGDTLLQGNLIFEGSVPDAHETTFSITNPTADRTITVPDADVDLTKVRAASDTLDGVVELATTAEATTGTDTSRAVTAAGVAAVHATAQAGKNYRIINTSFRQDIGTTKYFIPFKSQDENVTVHREEVSELAVCDGRVVSVSLRVENLNTHSGDANVTFGVTTNVVGAAYATFTEQETEALAINDGDDHDLFHYVFDNAKHWDSTDMFAISIQSDTDISGSNERFYITVVIEDDWSTYLAGSSRKISSTP